ncbi:hypothetical protein [Jiella marina]|uniref:hypothetical protein n=1 Tax=Jiella sp. LLJ827 TaxID=2917712 RepID=UPI002100764E|nr:hypothetical protein [Jiella sp. LLJ827]MCQ0990055.1 hypothetical protein [Jiella sp. LLJ827]
MAAARNTFGARSANPEGEPAQHFGRRKPTGPAAGHGARPDLVWSQVAGLSRGRETTSQPVQHGAGSASARPHPVSHRASRQRLTPARFGVLAAGFAFGLALLPTFLLSFPEAPVAATVFDSSATSSVRLLEVSASISERGEGKVLTITGTVENRGKAVAVIPTIRVDFENPDGHVNSRTLRTAVATLDPNQRVEIVSMIAVPARSDGEVRVGFLETAREGTP